MGIESGKGRERPARSPEQYEQDIQSDIHTLPSPLNVEWQRRLEAASDEELPALSEALRDFMSKRHDALIGRVPEVFKNMRHLVRDADAINHTLETIRDAEGDPSLFVGEGKTAHVFRDPQTATVCHKYVHDFTQYTNWNSVESEARFLEELEGLEVQGARTPFLYGVIDLPDTKVISMELLDAPSLDMFTLGRRPFPSDFDPHVFFTRLRAYVAAMHERNIYHRDLHEGNVLLGPDNTPYIIDFGRATTALSPEYASESFDKTGQIRIMLPTDEDWIYKVESKVYRALQKGKLAN